MARKVILDTDPGIDDAVALLVALFDARLDVEAVTAVAGNVSPELATRNVQIVVEQLDPPRLPRIGAASPPDQRLPADSLHINGRDGLGNSDFRFAEHHHLLPSDKVMADVVRANPGEVTILALGPLTNVARALQRDPDLAAQIQHLVIMGGALDGRGNATPAAEFNIYCDPQAARTVFRSPTTMTLVPLNVTRQVTMTYGLLDDLPPESCRAGRFLRQVLPFYYRAHHRELGLEGVQLHDAVALAAVTNPELFTTTPGAVDVETVGELTKGATVMDRRATPLWRRNMAVATELDAAAVKDCILRGIRQAGQQT